MKSRTCPKCGYKHSLKQHNAVFLKLGVKTFCCEKCDTVLTYSKTEERFLIVIPIVFSFILNQILRNTFDLSFGISAIIFLIFYISTFFILSPFLHYKLRDFKNDVKLNNSTLRSYKKL